MSKNELSKRDMYKRDYLHFEELLYNPEGTWSYKSECVCRGCRTVGYIEGTLECEATDIEIISKYVVRIYKDII